mgnify:CR=1 FL=1
MRGLKGSSILHLVDGMRLNNAFFRNAPNQYLALIDPLALGRVEVLRGPGAVLFGSDAMGGVINIITKKPGGPVAGLRRSTTPPTRWRWRPFWKAGSACTLGRRSGPLPGVMRRP